MDENLKQYCTERQWEYLCAVSEHGSNNKAAIALGVGRRTVDRAVKVVKATAALDGYAPESNLDYPIPTGFSISGVSDMQENEHGRPRWIKYSVSKEQQELLLEEFKQSLLDDLPKAKPIKPSKYGTLDDLLVAYPVGDAHFGMLAWGEECGEDFNLKIAESELCGAMDYLVSGSPKSTECAILLLGDFLHYDGMVAVTPQSKHSLDADSRFPQVVRAALRSIRYLVKSALKKHQKVRLIIEVGNHDQSMMPVFREMFSMFYENEPRLEVDTSPMNCHAFTFGKNLIATHHGDKIKMDKLISVISEDFRQMWGVTKQAYVHIGHVHHDHIKEFPGGKVESHGILAPKDAYAAQGGWRSKQSMKAITYHAEYGEVGRSFCTPDMLK